ncbi:hypothetical protein KO493_06655 [Tamlana agarivorans]|uniref:Uncharacterized protein n=1 Tax=Pseudotamlana agarivorans TaxID=481183 RepID=A0ACC5U7W7_9FLAO|nr:hypothetical protein [Tamlana agarivorans]MBU2950371.1 hypothetical protein [Tamlana agarivorans]
MKKLLILFTFCTFTTISKSQNASVEKSTYGIQTGFLGIWAHNEAKLTNRIALRTELGLDAGISVSSYNDSTKFLLAPVITLEPRWYYNLNKRIKKSRRIDGNSGNFISLKTSFHPDWFVITNHDNAHVIPNLAIIPTWGIRRNLGNHFNYETGIGLGYSHNFNNDTYYMVNKGEAILNLHLRIGYRF